jgi:hypothetical protein
LHDPSRRFALSDFAFVLQSKINLLIEYFCIDFEGKTHKLSHMKTSSTITKTVSAGPVCTHIHHHHHAPHTHEHPTCVATIIYNILVLIAEVGILFAFTHADAHELVAYEWVLQIIHLLGTALLGMLTWYLTHRLSHRATKP